MCHIYLKFSYLTTTDLYLHGIYRLDVHHSPLPLPGLINLQSRLYTLTFPILQCCIDWEAIVANFSLEKRVPMECSSFCQNWLLHFFKYFQYYLNFTFTLSKFQKIKTSQHLHSCMSYQQNIQSWTQYQDQLGMTV
jgi:hypothetical protein